jgi:acyl-CoA dehydrogenase family protein 9
MPPLVEQSFMKALFHGVIAEDMIFPYPEMGSEDRENTAMILDSVRRYFAANVDSARIDREEEIPEAVLDGLKGLGLFGLQIPTVYDGIGLSATAYARVMQEIGGLDPAIGITLGAHQSLGLNGILLFGTPEQKRRYLPKLATGEWVAAFALTEPSAGSDAAAIKTRAELSHDGSHYVLNGSKIWITNGGFADVFTIFARTSPVEEGKKPKITAFIVERDFGVKHGPNEQKLGVRGTSTTEIFLDDVHVPRENVLGEPGRGFKVAMEVLNSGRLGLAAGCVGISTQLVKMAIDRVQERRAFGRNIGEFALIKDKIATILADTYALESMTYLTAGIHDSRSADYSLESALCKIMGSEASWRVVNEALQIAAGSGYMGAYPYERLLRDARINMIFAGTNEILRAFVALSGMQGPGKALAEVVKAMREPIKGFGLLGDFAVRKARSVLGRERLSRAHALLSREAVIFEEFTGELASAGEAVLRKHGREIAEMQYTQRRIADMAMDLYALAACISRATRAIERRGEEGARRDIDLCQIFATSAQKRLRQNVQDLTRNDDELRKAVASRAYTDRAYPFDVL